MRFLEAEQVFKRLSAGETVPVVVPDTGVKFSIRAKEACGLTGYGIIPEGKKRPTRSPIMWRAEVLEWLCHLSERAA